MENVLRLDFVWNANCAMRRRYYASWLCDFRLTGREQECRTQSLLVYLIILS
jgi:hypothetical protein